MTYFVLSGCKSLTQSINSDLWNTSDVATVCCVWLLVAVLWFGYHSVYCRLLLRIISLFTYKCILAELNFLKCGILKGLRCWSDLSGWLMMVLFHESSIVTVSFLYHDRLLGPWHWPRRPLAGYDRLLGMTTCWVWPLAGYDPLAECDRLLGMTTCWVWLLAGYDHLLGVTTARYDLLLGWPLAGCDLLLGMTTWWVWPLARYDPLAGYDHLLGMTTCWGHDTDHDDCGVCVCYDQSKIKLHCRVWKGWNRSRQLAPASADQ